jgi:hypothetical protein
VGVAQSVELLVVVQAVAGSSPVAHLHEVAAQEVFLCHRHLHSEAAELPGTLAAGLPARRALLLNLLEALHYD